MRQGWISIHRTLLDDPIISKPNYLSVWVVLLLLANHEEHTFIWDNKKQICKRGQVLTGRKKLAQQTGVKETTLENILKYLENEQQIGQQKTTKFRLITIKNYDKYQDKRHQNGQQSDNRVTTNGQQSDTINNDNNYNNENKNISKDIQTESEVSQGSNLIKKDQYGNEEINKMLNTIKELLFLEDFKETKAMQRNFGKHLVGLKHKLGKDEFARRFMILGGDEFHRKNMGSLQYTYKQIKGFVPIETDNSIPSFGVDPTKR